MTAEKRRSCTDHCAGCGEHFHGLGAFDAHRRDGTCVNPGAVLYESGKREGEHVLQAWTHDGSCDKEKGCWHDGRRLRWVEPVTIWQLARTAAELESLQRLNR